MKTIVWTLTPLVLLAAGLTTLRAEDPIVAPGAKLQKLAGDFKFTEGPAADSRRKRLFHRPAQRSHSQMERQREALDLHATVRTFQRTVLRCERQPLGLRRRKERDVVDRPVRKDHGRCQGLPGKTAQRTQRRVGSARRRGLLHRPVLQAPLLEARPEGAVRRLRLLFDAQSRQAGSRDLRPETAQRHHRHA